MAMGRYETSDWTKPAGDFRHGEADTLLEALRDVVRAMWRGRLWIAASGLCGILLGLTFLAFTNPLYSATAQILIEPRPKQLLQTEVVPSGLNTSYSGPDTLLVDSQVEIILSDSVLRRVVMQADLAADPEFARPRGGGLTSLLAGAGRSPAHASTLAVPLGQSPEAAALENLRKSLTVRRTGNTYLLSVNVLSERPEMAKQLADAVADAYLEDIRDAARDGTRQTTEMLSSRLEELREEVRQAERRVESFREQQGLIGAQDLLINEQQLRDLNDRLTEARTRTSETEVKHRNLVRLAERGINGVESMGEAISSRVISELRAAYGTIVRELSNAEMVYGARHPRVSALQSERRGIERTIEEELARLARNAEQQYEIARAHEESLERRLEQLEAITVGSNRALVELRELQREAEAARAIYEAFLTRAKQASEQENLSNNNSRILARAEMPFRPAYPPASFVLAAAVFIGLSLGALLAWVRHVTATA